MSWRLSAACRGQDHRPWFPLNGDYAAALAVCEACTVRRECLESALALNAATDCAGMFGGATPGQRDAIRRRRRREEAA